MWTFAVRNGTYAISFTVRRRTFTRHVKVHAKPGTSITLDVTA